MAGQSHCVSLLLDHGIDVHAVDKTNRTALFYAVEKGYAETANVLIQAETQVQHRDSQGRVPIHFAALYGHLPVLSLLLSNGAEVDAKDDTLKTALHYGSCQGHNEIVKYLLEHGANINLLGMFLHVYEIFELILVIQTRMDCLRCIGLLLRSTLTQWSFFWNAVPTQIVQMYFIRNQLLLTMLKRLIQIPVVKFCCVTTRVHYP